MTTELEQAKAKLAALIKEDLECDAVIKQYEAALKRKRELHNGWRQIGEIEEAKRKVRDLQSGPIIERDEGYGRHKRVIGISDKFILTRFDGEEDTNRYRRSDGMKQGTRKDARYANPIDVAEAVRMWEEWCAARKTTTQYPPK